MAYGFSVSVGSIRIIIYGLYVVLLYVYTLHFTPYTLHSTGLRAVLVDVGFVKGSVAVEVVMSGDGLKAQELILYLYIDLEHLERLTPHAAPG